MARTEKFILKSGTLFDKNESNEITSSLKLFAAMALKKPDSSDSWTSIEDIKSDFQNNGVIVDEFNILVDESDFMSPAQVGKFKIACDMKDLKNPLEVREFNNLRDKGVQMNAPQVKDSCGNSKPTKKASKKKPVNPQFCVFCENNKEPISVVRSHAVRDSLGRVECPKLRSYKCPLCNAFGDNAHTVKYCPKRPIITMEDTILAQRLGKLYPFTNIISILNV